MYDKLQEVRARREAGDKGFTLIELLVVVVIIGILVAIAIPLYLNYKHGAEDDAAKSDIRNAAPLVEQYYADNNAYPADQATFDGLNPHFSNGVVEGTYKLETGGWCLDAASANGAHFNYNSTVGKVATGTCA